MLNIIIDGRMVKEHLDGIARYTYELINGLLQKDDVNIKVLTNNIDLSKKVFKIDNDNMFIKMKSEFLSPLEVIEYPILLNKYKDYIFHSPSFSASPFIKLKSFITIHDLNHLALPQYYSKIKQYYYKFAVKPFAKKCEKIFTVSEFSKKEIVKWLGCDEDKVIVTYNGVDTKFKKINDNLILEKIKEKYSLSDKFVLYIGNQKPHKNLKTLIKAMTYVDNNIKLIINGKPSEEISKLIEENNLNKSIKFIGYLDDQELPIIYNLASAFVFPSLYEGFGLPPLEAMACGCPTIVANTSSLPEVVGDAAIIIEAEDYIDLAKNIDDLVKESSISNKLVKLGYLNAEKFKWSTMVNETFESFRNTL